MWSLTVLRCLAFIFLVSFTASQSACLGIPPAHCVPPTECAYLNRDLLQPPGMFSLPHDQRNRRSAVHTRGVNVTDWIY